MEATGVDRSGKWGGHFTLNQDDPELWISEQSAWPDCTSLLRFSLAEVIEAGLRAKITGLSDAHREAAIADCVGSTQDELKRLREMLAACQDALHG